MHDILVIGAGPNGIYTFHSLKERFPDKKISLIEKIDIVNSLKQYPNINWHSPCNELDIGDLKNNWSENHPKTEEVISYYHKFFKTKSLNFIKDEIKSIKKRGHHISLFGIKEKYNCKILILATGIFDNKNSITNTPLPDYASYNFPSLELKNKNLVLVGGGNSAIDFVVSLLPHNNISWIIKGSNYTGSCANPDHFKNFQNIISKYKTNLSLYKENRIKKLNADKSITLTSGKVISDVDSCHMLTGYNGLSPLLLEAGALFYNKFPAINEFNETSLKNIFVVGSLSSKHDEPIYIHNGNPSVINRMMSNINERL
jgi:thioredoxin reductase